MILNTLVEKLIEHKNRVVFDPHQRREMLTVDAVALMSYQGRAFQVLFSKDLDAPLTWDGEVQFLQQGRHDEPTPVVYVCDEFQGMLGWGYGEIRSWKDANELFALLMVRVRGGLEILEFCATKPVCPILYDDAKDVYDGQTGFVDSKGRQHLSQMLIQLRPARNGLESLSFPNRLHDSFSGDKVSNGKLETGNILMWSQSDNSIHWVTRGVDGVIRSMGTAGDAMDFNDFLHWGRRFSVKGWVVGDIYPMPYYLPKGEPAPEKPKPADPDAVINSVLQQLVNRDAYDIRPATVALLDAIFSRHSQPMKPVDRSAEYEQLAGDTILEYSAGKSAAIIKALNEAKLLITAAFVKKSNEECK